ncbi:MAG: GldG family protein [Proteobacteria bacterium]|nr:GldG family protein [Pseudomonadota bacterium]
MLQRMRNHHRHRLAYPLLVIGSLVLANLIAGQRFFRADLTADGHFSLDPASARLAKGLNDRLTIKIFLSRDLPPSAAAIGRKARDLLLEYAARAHGRIAVEAVDPGLTASGQREAARAKIPPLQLGLRSRTRRSVQLGYLGVSLQYGGRIEAVPNLLSVGDLEYPLSAAIKRLRQTTAVHVGFSAGHGEPTLDDGLSAAARALSDHVLATVPLDPAAGPIPDDLDLLIVVSPRRPFARSAQRALDSFLMRGKALILLLDHASLDLRASVSSGGELTLRAEERATGLDRQLARYGVQLGAQPILDPQTRALPLAVAQDRAILVHNPVFPLITDLSRDHAATRTLRELVLVLPTAVGLAPRSTIAGGSGAVLARTSPASWRHVGPLVFDPRQPAPAQAARGPFSVAVYRRGVFRSFFSDASASDPEAAGTAATASASAEDQRQQGAALVARHSLPSAQLVVFGDGDFVHDRHLHTSPTGLLLLRNLVDVVSGDDDLVALRSKQHLRRPLHQIDESAARLLQHATGLGPPLLVLLLGLASWALRQRRRRLQAAALIAGRARWSLAPATRLGRNHPPPAGS